VASNPLVDAQTDPDSICPGTATDIILDGRGSQPGLVYQWSTPSGSVNIQNEDSIITQATVNGSTEFTLTVTDTSTGCSNSSLTSIAVYSESEPQANKTTFCNVAADKTATLCVIGGETGDTYDWSVTSDTSLFTSPPLTDSCEIVDLADKRTGTYPVGVNVSNSRTGCNYSDTVELNVLPPIQTEAGPDSLLFSGETVRLFARGGTNYLWRPDTNLTDANSASPEAQPKSSTTYVVEVDSNGCLAYDTVRLEVIDSMDCSVPNAFTPNGDGLNDRLLIHCLGESELVQFKVFNRWGEVVYRANSKHGATEVGWDGQYKGKKQEMDTYAYILILKTPEGEKRIKSGSITLIR
jgi:gliding motility-associated-like protein